MNYMVTITNFISRLEFNNKRKWILSTKSLKRLLFFIFFEIVLTGATYKDLTQEIEKLNLETKVMITFYGDEKEEYPVKKLQEWFDFFRGKVSFDSKNDKLLTVNLVTHGIRKNIFDDIYCCLIGKKLYFKEPSLEHFFLMEIFGLRDDLRKKIVGSMLKKTDDVLMAIKNIVFQVEYEVEFTILKVFLKFVTQIYKFVDAAGVGSVFKIWSIPTLSEDYEGKNHEEIKLRDKEYNIIEEIMDRYNSIVTEDKSTAL